MNGATRSCCTIKALIACVRVEKNTSCWRIRIRVQRGQWSVEQVSLAAAVGLPVLYYYTWLASISDQLDDAVSSILLVSAESDAAYYRMYNSSVSTCSIIDSS